MSELDDYTKVHWKNVVLCKECKYIDYKYMSCKMWARDTVDNGWCFKGKERFKEKKND